MRRITILLALLLCSGCGTGTNAKRGGGDTAATTSRTRDRLPGTHDRAHQSRLGARGLHRAPGRHANLPRAMVCS